MRTTHENSGCLFDCGTSPRLGGPGSGFSLALWEVTLSTPFSLSKPCTQKKSWERQERLQAWSDQNNLKWYLWWWLYKIHQHCMPSSRMKAYPRLRSCKSEGRLPTLRMDNQQLQRAALDSWSRESKDVKELDVNWDQLPTERALDVQWCATMTISHSVSPSSLSQTHGERLSVICFI